ncbi:MAG: hypothetical protein ACAI35_27355 [Candidatus Methylacidiphilales bacterium]|nr:hypothetical protein [Candidatus Methylacidiphilales bacterium]
MTANDILQATWAAAASFLTLTVVFWPLERMLPAKPGQAALRPGWATDACFFLGQYLGLEQPHPQRHANAERYVRLVYSIRPARCGAGIALVGAGRQCFAAGGSGYLLGAPLSASVRRAVALSRRAS